MCLAMRIVCGHGKDYLICVNRKPACSDYHWTAYKKNTRRELTKVAAGTDKIVMLQCCINALLLPYAYQGYVYPDLQGHR
jgi:hypothetical protein